MSLKNGQKIKGIPVGLQLYSVREQCKKNLAETLAAVAEIGYQGVEFAGYHGFAAKDLRKMLDGLGLACCGTHTPLDSVLPGKLQETIEFNKALGNKFLIVPWMENKSKQEWLKSARLFNGIAEKLKPHGMLVGYHAHAHDFKKIDGEASWDIFIGATKNDVAAQMDTGNCYEGGGDPVSFLKKYPGRAQSVHLKPGGAGPDAAIGEDKVDWQAVFDFCETKGATEWYIVEHENSKSPLDAVRRCHEALKKMGRAK